MTTSPSRSGAAAAKRKAAGNPPAHLAEATALEVEDLRHRRAGGDEHVAIGQQDRGAGDLVAAVGHLGPALEAARLRAVDLGRAVVDVAGAVGPADDEHAAVGEPDRIVLVTCGRQRARRLEATGARAVAVAAGLEDLRAREDLQLLAPPAVSADDEHAAVREQRGSVALARHAHRARPPGERPVAGS
jgi:hypothetical protein